jgi:hypothetical protein
MGVRDDNDVRLSASLEQPEYGDFASGVSSALLFSGVAKVAFVDLNLSREPRLCLGEL